MARSNFLLFSFFVLGLSLASVSDAGNKVFYRPMVGTPALGGFQISAGGAVHIAAFITNVEGRIAVCGFWKKAEDFSSFARATRLAKKGLAAASVRYEKRTLIRGLNFMQEVSEKEYVAGTKAACKLTKRAWHKSLSNEKTFIQIARIRLVN